MRNEEPCTCQITPAATPLSVAAPAGRYSEALSQSPSARMCKSSVTAASADTASFLMACSAHTTSERSLAPRATHAPRVSATDGAGRDDEKQHNARHPRERRKPCMGQCCNLIDASCVVGYVMQRLGERFDKTRVERVRKDSCVQNDAFAALDVHVDGTPRRRRVEPPLDIVCKLRVCRNSGIA